MFVAMEVMHCVLPVQLAPGGAQPAYGPGGAAVIMDVLTAHVRDATEAAIDAFHAASEDRKYVEAQRSRLSNDPPPRNGEHIS